MALIDLTSPEPAIEETSLTLLEPGQADLAFQHPTSAGNWDSLFIRATGAGIAMTLHSVTRRLRGLAAVSTLAVRRLGARQFHLCQLVAAVSTAGLPRTTLTKIIDVVCGPNRALPNRVHMHPSLVGGGSGSVAEMAALSVIVAGKRPRASLEFGTYDGCSTWHIWANSEGSVTTVDLPSGAVVEGSTDDVLQGTKSRSFLPDDSRVRLVEADSREWEPDIAGGIDFCFIDAGHSYECVRNDTEKALRVMNKGGVVLWHDATWRRDGYAVNDYLKDLRRQGRDVRLLEVGPLDYCSLAVMIV